MNRPLRISFCGSNGTGKTTLAKLLAEADNRVTFIPSTARVALQQGYQINTEADPLSQLLTTVSRIAAEADAEGEVIVSDRTPLDSLAYTHYQFDRIWAVEDKTDFYLDTSYSIVKQAMQRYDHVFYFPPYFAPLDDGVRSGDTKYQLDIANYMENLLDMLSVKYHEVPYVSPEARLDWLLGVTNLTPATI